MDNHSYYNENGEIIIGEYELPYSEQIKRDDERREREREERLKLRYDEDDD